MSNEVQSNEVQSNEVQTNEVQSNEVQTNEVQTNEIQFTRYLYEKDEVKLALSQCILNKKEEEALFWAYELYYSGFQNELVSVFWTLYYDFYYSLNHSFEKYLQTKLKNNLELDTNSANYISMIVNNFMIRSHTMDVFMLKQVVDICEFDKTDIQDYIISANYDIIHTELLSALRTKDFMMLASFILSDIKDKHLLDTLNTIVGYFVTNIGLKNDINYAKILQNKNHYHTNNKRTLILAKTIHYFTVAANAKMGKNIYVHVEPEDVVLYETIRISPNLSPRKILPLAKIYSIDANNYLSLFDLKREKQDIKTAYYYNWLYHASFSPLWRARILKCNGIIDAKNKQVIFGDEDSDDFYDKYGYEPDEQTAAVENKTIQDIKKERIWLSFYKEHNKNGLVEIDADILDTMDKVVYNF